MGFGATSDHSTLSNATDIKTIDLALELDVDFDRKVLAGSVTHSVRVESESVDKFVLDSNNLSLIQCTIDGRLYL